MVVHTDLILVFIHNVASFLVHNLLIEELATIKSFLISLSLFQTHYNLNITQQNCQIVLYKFNNTVYLCICVQILYVRYLKKGPFDHSNESHNDSSDDDPRFDYCPH